MNRPEKDSPGGSSKEQFIVRDTVVANRLGLHARPAALFAKIASRFDSEIMLEKKDGTKVSGKSLMGLLSLQAASGTPIRISAQGPDAPEACEELTKLVEGQFQYDSTAQ